MADVCSVNLRTIQRVESLGVAAPETIMALAAILEVEQSQIVIDPLVNRPGFMPKTDRGITLLSIFATIIGVIIGFLLASLIG